MVLALGAALGLAGAAHAQTPATLTDIGVTAPTPGPNDIAQLTAPLGSSSPDGLNYYFDNGSPPGQTFTTGNNPNGYLLTSLSLYTAGNSGSLPAAGQAYLLRVYSVSGTNATLLATYISANNFIFTDLDWLQWTNLGVALAPNGQYAYSFGRIGSGSGWENMGNVGGDPYAGGEGALIPPNGGGMTLGSSHGFDATFVVGLTAATAITVDSPTIAPQNAVVAGTPATISAVAAGTAPLAYQWQTDGGTGGSLTNIPAANGATLAVNTTGLAVGPYQFAVVVTNSVGAVTSAVVTLGISAPVAAATLASLGGTASPGPNDLTQFVGGGNRDGLNYYDDNGANNDGWTGQTFTTGTNAQGYYLTSVAFQTGGGGSSGVGTAQPYELFLYSVKGSSATLMAHYTNASFSFNDGDWLRWSGFSPVLRSNTTYAYAFGRAASGSGWEALAVSPTNTDLYPEGQICLIPAAGGTMTFGVSGNADAVFDVGLLPIGVGPDPKPFAGTISVAPASTVTAGTLATLSQAATGAAPLYYQWQTDGGSGGALTNIPAANSTNLVVDTASLRPGAYRYDFVVTNLFGSATGTVVTLTVVYADTTASLADVGASIPTPMGNDIAQLTAPSAASSPDGLNYYFDNGSPPGQTFTTGSDPRGYALTSLAIKLAGNSGGLPAAGQAYVLRLYSVSGSTATLYATYTSPTNFTYTTSDWLRWSGFAVPLANNATYAYTFGRVSTGSGWENLANVSGNPYPGGEVVLIPRSGGAIAFGSSHDFDATFVIGTIVSGYPAAPPATFSPSNTVYAGTPVTVSAPVAGTGPFTYQWQTDGGVIGGTLTNIPGATNATLIVDTMPLSGMLASYALVAANTAGASMGEIATLTVNPPSLPLVIPGADTTPLSASRFVGGSVTFAAGFAGTLPIAYQWQVDKGAGPVGLPGQTNATLALTNLQLSDAGNYSLVASNSQGTASSSPATLSVWPGATAPFTVNFQWHSTEGGNDVGVYGGSGIPTYGSGTYWNQVNGPSPRPAGAAISTSDTGYADDGVTDTHVAWTLVTSESWDWTSTPVIPLLDSAVTARPATPAGFTFYLPNGLYNLVLFSCNGTESATADGGAVFTVNGMTRTALPTQDTSFVEGNNYVVFRQLAVTGGMLTGSCAAAAGKNYGSLNGAQVQFLGPAVTLQIQPVTGGKVQLQWSQGTLLEATSVTGPWTTNSATSPYTLTPTAAQKFYRVRVR